MAGESRAKSIAEFSEERLKKVKKIENYDKVEERKSGEEEKVDSNPQDDKSHIEELAEAVRFASEKTGVREDFLMGMLAVESDLGRNTGKCTYAQVEAGVEKSYRNGLLGQKSYDTFIERRELVKNIAKETGRNHEELTVSCNPARYVGTGGAMGVPQFMPDTWIHYKDKIAEIVEKDNPDPWILKDGIVAMALLLSNTPGVTEHNNYAERNAAKIYLSGTTSSKHDWYVNKIMYWSKNYKSLMG